MRWGRATCDLVNKNAVPMMPPPQLLCHRRLRIGHALPVTTRVLVKRIVANLAGWICDILAIWVTSQ